GNSAGNGSYDIAEGNEAVAAGESPEEYFERGGSTAIGVLSRHRRRAQAQSGASAVEESPGGIRVWHRRPRGGPASGCVAGARRPRATLRIRCKQVCFFGCICAYTL